MSTFKTLENILMSPTVLMPRMTKHLSQPGRMLKTEVMLPTEERSTWVKMLALVLVWFHSAVDSLLAMPWSPSTVMLMFARTQVPLLSRHTRYQKSISELHTH